MYARPGRSEFNIFALGNSTVTWELSVPVMCNNFALPNMPPRMNGGRSFIVKISKEGTKSDNRTSLSNVPTLLVSTGRMDLASALAWTGVARVRKGWLYSSKVFKTPRPSA